MTQQVFTSFRNPTGLWWCGGFDGGDWLSALLLVMVFAGDDDERVGGDPVD